MSESQINVGMNVDGVVAGTEKVKRKLSELGGAARDAGTEAGKGIGSIGNGAEASAKRLDSATKNTIASLQRQTAAIEAGGTATRAYQEQLAKMRGVDVNVLKPYLDQLDQAKIKQQAAVASQASMAQGFADIKLQVLAASAAIVGFIAGFSKLVDGVDKLNDLKDATGSTIENISALEDVALRTGTSFDTVGAALLKFNGVLKDSKAGSDSAAAFDALGVSVKELKALDPAEALQKVARAFAGFEDNGNKARIMQELFGKSTRDVAALMVDLAEKTSLVPTVMTKAANEAEIFNKHIAGLQKNMLDAARAMTGPMVEGLNGLIAKFKEGSNAGDGFLTTLLKQTEIYRLISKIPGFGGGVKAPQFLLDYNQSDAEAARLARSAARPSLPDLPDQAANKAAAADAARLLAEQNRELKEQAKLLAELGGLNGSFADDWERLSKIYKAGKISLDDLVKAQAALLEKQPAIKAAADAQEKAAKDLAKAEQERRDELEKTLALYATASVAGVASAVAAANAAEDELATYGLLKSAVQGLTLASLEQSRELAALAGEDVANIEIRIAAQKRLIAATQGVEAKKASEEAQRIAEKSAADAASEWAKAAEKIQDSITDALLRGFESGKDFAANLRDTVVNMFKTMVLRPVISAVVNPVAQGLTGSLGLSGAANAAGSAGSLLGAGASIFGSGGLSGALAGGAGWLTGSTTLSGALSAGASLIGTGSMAGLASGVGVLAGALGPIALGIGVLSSLFGGEKNKQQNTGNATSFFDATGTLTKQDTFFGGSSSSADTVINGLQSAYAKAAAALSIGTVATAFNFGSNVRKDGTDPRFALGAYAGTSAFQQTETASSDAAISLAASRAVFAALQGSELPGYLASVFNSLDPAAASQDAITGTLAFAASLKQVREALLETRTPLQILQDDLAAGTASLKTSAETFKGDFLAAIDAGITPELLTQWQALGNTMDQLAAASGNAEEAITTVTRSLQDIANERQSLQDQLDELTLTSAQLRAKERATIDASNVSLYDQVQAQKDLQASAAAAAEAATTAANALAAAAETLRATNAAALNGATAGAADAFAALQRAVAAEQASNAAAYEAQRAIATAAYTSQQTTMQASIDATRVSLSSVADSIGRIKNLSGSLKSALDGMRLAGSDGSNRATAQGEISAALARARIGGGLPLDGQLSAALATVARPSEQLFSSFEDYARDFYRTANDISALSSLSDSQLSGAQSAQSTMEAQLETLQDQKEALKVGFDAQIDSLAGILNTAQLQLDAANGINTSVLSVADAVAALNASIAALANVRASQGLATTPGVAENRLDIIRGYMQGLADDKSLTDIQKANVLAAASRANGVSEAEITAAWGGSAAITRQFFQNAGIAQFAVGTNYVPRDGLAMIHEGEAIIPRAFNPSAGGAGNADMVAEIRALRKDLAALQASSEATAASSRKTAAMIETATEGGRAMLTETYT